MNFALLPGKNQMIIIKIVEFLLRLNVWMIFFISVFGAVAFSIVLGLLLNTLFYDGSNNLLMLGAVVIPMIDAPIFIVLLIIMIKELRQSRQELDSRVKARTADLEMSNKALKQEIQNRERLQAQLVQAQKMESVGRLAGGVAHDFNNMLSIIIGYSQLVMGKISPDEPLHADLQEIHQAAQRSTEITGKLLAFARKQTVSPVVLDLNTAIEGMLKMLGRLLREDITLSWHPGNTVWQIYIDPSQVDQLLMNLCVNARDAIEGTGEIIIETDNVVIDPDYCTEHNGFVPGEFVMLSVSDNGCGMDNDTRDHIFEPFFTTKQLGHGTGLGLPMVYGIMKQNMGFINVYSEPSRGTTFKMYFPRNKTGNHGTPLPEKITHDAGRGEIILVVEDEASLLKMATRLLKSLNYSVLSAASPGDALKLAEKHAGKIHLLLTDVIMPEMNGRELSDRLTAVYPNLKTLFMSGYTANVIAHQGILEKGIHFIQKPLTINSLAAKVRQVLGSQ